MASSFWTDSIKISKIKENFDHTKLYQLPKEKSDLLIPLISPSFNLSNNTPSNLSLNKISKINNNSSLKFENIYNNSALKYFNQNIDDNNQANNEQKKENKFLEKKRKIHFNVMHYENKPLFITNKNEGNFILNTNTINDNKTKINLENSNSSESNFLNKDAGKNNLLGKTFPKKEMPKLFNTINYNLFENSMNKNKIQEDGLMKNTLNLLKLM